MVNLVSELIDEYRERLMHIDENLHDEIEKVALNQKAIYELRGMKSAFREILNDLQELREELR